MIQTTAIRLQKQEPMMVTWDLGRRCNYDCTYCAASRHNNTSPHAPLEELEKTLEFISNYVSLYNEKRISPIQTNIDFTGGEPTVNPQFWSFVKHIKENYKNFNVGLTTNGTWPEYRIDDIVKYIDGITISWHAEADESLKARVIENIKKIKENNIWLQVNVMLHCDHFEEAKSVCSTLKELGVKYNPVPIGDGTTELSGWFKDEDGTLRRTSHSYNEEQQEWFWNEVGINKKAEQSSEGTAIGRKCCGGRCLEGKVDKQWQSVTLVDNKFETWNCSVNWFFLHIDQETGEVYHHQTCQALFDGKKGALGNLNNSEIILHDLKTRLSTDSTPCIVCPNYRCGCGMCVPKAMHKNDFDELFKDISNLKTY